MIKVRINRNRSEAEGLQEFETDGKVHVVVNREPLIEVKDEHTLWLWISKNVQVELNDDMIEEIIRQYYYGMEPYLP